MSTFRLYKYFITLKELQLFHSTVLQQITKFSIVYELLEKKNNFTFVCIRKTHMQKYKLQDYVIKNWKENVWNFCFPRDLIRLTKQKKFVISYFKKSLTQRRVNHYVILRTSSLYDFRSFHPGTDQSPALILMLVPLFHTIA